jgi:hypothetical protein
MRHDCVMLLKRLVTGWLLGSLANGVMTLTISASFAGNGMLATRIPHTSTTALHQTFFRGTVELSDLRMLTSSIPKGWRTYTYHRAAISVPRSWVVRHANYSCADTTLPVSGTLFFLPQSSSDVCVRSTFNTNSVTLSVLPAGDI